MIRQCNNGDPAPVEVTAGAAPAPAVQSAAEPPPVAAPTTMVDRTAGMLHLPGVARAAVGDLG